MWIIKDTSIDDLIELYDYYEQNPEIFEKWKKEIEEEMAFVDSCLLGEGEFIEESTDIENSDVSQSI